MRIAIVRNGKELGERAFLEIKKVLLEKPDAVIGFGLFDLVQSQIAQVDRRTDRPALHLEPQHAAQHHIIFLLA